MPGLDPPCLDGKDVFHSEPRCQRNPDGTLIVEIDLDLDVRVTLIFARKDAPIEYRGAYRDVTQNDRVHRARYPHDVAAELVQQAHDRALEACATYDGEPQTERRGTS